MNKKARQFDCGEGNAQNKNEQQGNAAGGQQDSAEADKAEIVRQLTQKQYELAKELAEGIDKLNTLIQDTEKYTCKAKGKYQK